jgi:hypothetical protein
MAEAGENDEPPPGDRMNLGGSLQLWPTCLIEAQVMPIVKLRSLPVFPRRFPLPGHLANRCLNAHLLRLSSASRRGAGTRLMELASVEICSAQCPHCGAMNTFRGVSVIEAFVCRERGEGVSIERPVP